MATDAHGHTIAPGDRYAVRGVVRKVSGDDVVVVAGDREGVHCAAGDLRAPPVVMQFVGDGGEGGSTSVDLMAGTPFGVAVPMAVRSGKACVVFRHTSGNPGAVGDWTLRLKKFNPSTNKFEQVASLAVSTT